MAKPVINKIGIFDASLEKTITFSWDMQPYYNELIVYDADTLSVVYDATVSSMKTQHVLAAGTLTNGKKYAAQVKGYTYNKEDSSLSDYIYFICLSTPIVKFTTFDSDIITITTSTLDAVVTYSQSENEKINYCKFILWNENGQTQISTSDTIYNNASPTHTFKMLENGKTYQVQCTGITQNGIILDTGKVVVHAQYVFPTNYSAILAESNNNDGIVDYRTNLVLVEATENDYSYVDGSIIDLIDRTLTYKQGFSITDDYLLGVKMKNTSTPDGLLLTLKDDDSTTCLYAVETENEGYYRFKLVVENNAFKYLIYSEELNDLEVTVWIERNKNLYDLTVVYGGD